MKQLHPVPARNIARIAVGVGLLLLIPLALTLFNPQASLYGGPGGGWDWMPGDFVVIGILLLATGVAIDFAVRNLTNPVYRATTVLAIVATLLLIWIELAVDGVSQLVIFIANFF